MILNPWTPHSPHNSNVHTGPGSNISVISQSQPDHELNSDEDKYANDISPPTIGDEEIDNNSVVNYCNAVFDKTDDYLSAELKSILDFNFAKPIFLFSYKPCIHQNVI